MVYEWREYVATAETVQALHRRFREHTLKLFERHGIEVLGFWTPSDRPEVITYLARYPSMEARDAAWKAFAADPEWQQVKAQSEASGPLVKEMRGTVLLPTDYSSLK